MTDYLEAAARSIGALADESRRAMYLFIARRGAPVGREEAARAAGVSVKLAAWHLDKLVAAGLLQAHYARLPGRGGPGAGRSSKLYEPARAHLQVSIPPRAYDLVGRVLLEALETRRPDETPVDAARRAGREVGTRIAEERSAGRSRGATGASVEPLLDELGYVPRRDGTEVTLTNCPFHALAERNPELVCGMNEALISGLLDALHATGLEASLAPAAGRCCVVVSTEREAS